MKKIRYLKFIICLFFIFQLCFSLFFGKIAHMQNCFPFYDWHIFNTVPGKSMSAYFIYIHELNSHKYIPPVNIFELKLSFPGLDFYALSSNIYRLGNNISSEETPRRIANLNLILHKYFQFVHWELVKKDFDPIQYYLNKKTTNETRIWIYAD